MKLQWLRHTLEVIILLDYYYQSLLSQKYPKRGNFLESFLSFDILISD